MRSAIATASAASGSGVCSVTCWRSSRRNDWSGPMLPSRFEASSRSQIAWTSLTRARGCPGGRISPGRARLDPWGAQRPAAGSGRRVHGQVQPSGHLALRQPHRQDHLVHRRNVGLRRNTCAGIPRPQAASTSSSRQRTCSPTASRSRRSAARPWNSAHALTCSTPPGSQLLLDPCFGPVIHATVRQDGPPHRPDVFGPPRRRPAALTLPHCRGHRGPGVAASMVGAPWLFLPAGKWLLATLIAPGLAPQLGARSVSTRWRDWLARLSGATRRARRPGCSIRNPSAADVFEHMFWYPLK